MGFFPSIRAPNTIHLPTPSPTNALTLCLEGWTSSKTCRTDPPKVIQNPVDRASSIRSSFAQESILSFQCERGARSCTPSWNSALPPLGIR